MNSMTMSSLCRLKAAYQTYRPAILEAAVGILSTGTRDALRFKDVVEILRTCDEFSFFPEAGLMNRIISCWPSADEITGYPAYFISYMSLITSLGYFPNALLEQCLSRSFLQHAKGWTLKLFLR